MLKTKNENFVMGVISYLPEGLAEEILRIGRGRRWGLCSLSEISLRVGGRCTLLADGEKLSLLTAITAEDMEILKNIEHIKDYGAHGFFPVFGGKM